MIWVLHYLDALGSGGGRMILPTGAGAAAVAAGAAAFLGAAFWAPALPCRFHGLGGRISFACFLTPFEVYFPSQQMMPR
jgi:hypothetical protein